jgi:predicted ATPase
MADQHQLSSIIATATCDACKDHSERRIDPEEAKQIAKCIVETLTGVGLEIVPVSND